MGFVRMVQYRWVSSVAPATLVIMELSVIHKSIIATVVLARILGIVQAWLDHSTVAVMESGWELFATNLVELAIMK
jgi:hypothetical protein